jgi:hypothetical protein
MINKTFIDLFSLTLFLIIPLSSKYPDFSENSRNKNRALRRMDGHEFFAVHGCPAMGGFIDSFEEHPTYIKD